jgi:aspartyl/asparaginyl-tRNA synthetase
MEAKLIRNISIACSVVGLAILFFLSRTVELRQTDINQISPEDDGKNVKVCGNVSSKSISKTNHVFLKLRDKTGSIEIVIFNSTTGKVNMNFDKYSDICVVGSIDEYANKTEIIAKDIQVV